MGRENGLEQQVDGLIPHGMVAVDVEEMAARAVETGSGMAYHRRRWRPPNRNTRWGTSSEDAREGAFGVTWCIRGGSSRRSTGHRKPARSTEPLMPRTLERGIPGSDYTELNP